MTNALVHKTGAAIQWARDYGQAHPKMQGIFWIISTAILTIVPNELVKFMWKFTGKNIAEFAVTAITISGGINTCAVHQPPEPDGCPGARRISPGGA